jgi:DNA repair exonuclease SbcCD ATPase subunit
MKTSTNLKIENYEKQLKDSSYEKNQQKAQLDSFLIKIKALEEDIQLMHSENRFYNDNAREFHTQQEKLQNHIKDLQHSINSLTSENKQKDNAIKLLDEENHELKKRLNGTEGKYQDMLIEKERELAARARDFKEKTNFILTPKVPGLKNAMPKIDFFNEEALSNRKELFNTQKERIKNAVDRLMENREPDSPLKNLKMQSPDKSPESSYRTGGFTFRKSTTPSKEDVKAKIAALMQNRSRIEKKLHLLHNEQDNL